MQRKALIIQHVACETAGEIDFALTELGVARETVKVFADQTVPADLRDATCLVIMGGPMSVNDASLLPHIRDEMRLVESALKANVPILGVCLGSQLLASVLGASVRSAPRKEIGWHEVTVSEEGRGDPLFRNFAPRFDALHWHGEVYELPGGAVHLASSQLTSIQAFRYGKAAYGVLFHMEVTKRGLCEMTNSFVEELQAEGLDGDEICRGAETRLPLLQGQIRKAIPVWLAL